MSYTIQLKRTHQLVLLETLAASCEYKISRIKMEKHKITTDYYLDAAEKVRVGTITVNHPTKNIAEWIRDQIHHSGNLNRSELGRFAIAICEAIKQQEYDLFCQQPLLGSLFVEATDNV
jgi:hypothetical protein